MFGVGEGALQPSSALLELLPHPLSSSKCTSVELAAAACCLISTAMLLTGHLTDFPQ